MHLAKRAAMQKRAAEERPLEGAKRTFANLPSSVEGRKADWSSTTAMLIALTYVNERRNGTVDFHPKGSPMLRLAGALIKNQGIGDLCRIYSICQRDGIDFNLASIPPDFREALRRGIPG